MIKPRETVKRLQLDGKKAQILLLCFFLIATMFLTSCSKKSTDSDANLSESTGTMDFSFSDRDLNWDYDASEATYIDLSEEGSEITIDDEGTYVLSGSATDTMITVDAEDTDKIQLVLDNVTMTNSQGPCLYVKSADKVFITLEDGTVNSLSDGASYTLTDDDSTLDGAIFSRSDLTINGEGALNVSGNYKHGVVSKDDLILVAATVNVQSQNVGLSGKDCVKIGYADVTITSGSDGVRSDNTEDSTRGFVYFEEATLDITATNDGIQAETVYKGNDSSVTIVSGGGSSQYAWDSEESYKGIKAGTDILIEEGTYNIDSLDDAIHCNNTITISSGTFQLSAGDDGIHADNDLSISGGDITVSKSFEGLEGSRVLISGGDITVNASDDGINAVGGDDNTDSTPMGPQDGFSMGTGEIIISGGNLLINASGDGIDSNGSLTVSGGVTLVSGPTDNGNGALDCDSTIKVTGGVFIALGSSGMAQGFTEAEGQGAILYNFSTQSAGATFAVYDSSGNELASFTPSKAYQSAVVSAPGIESGGTYTLTAGGTTLATVEMTSSLYSAGSMGAMGGGTMGGGGAMTGNAQPGGQMPGARG